MMTLKVNGLYQRSCRPGTPLLYVLRDECKINAPPNSAAGLAVRLAAVIVDGKAVLFA